jgi:hypothetical protein
LASSPGATVRRFHLPRDAAPSFPVVWIAVPVQVFEVGTFLGAIAEQLSSPNEWKNALLASAAEILLLLQDFLFPALRDFRRSDCNCGSRWIVATQAVARYGAGLAPYDRHPMAEAAFHAIGAISNAFLAAFNAKSVSPAALHKRLHKILFAVLHADLEVADFSILGGLR